MGEKAESESIGISKPQFDEAQVKHALEQMRSEQNLGMAAMAGVAGALLGATVWAVVTVYTKFQIGWMAVGVGFLVGTAIRNFGKGLDQTFGVLGAVLSLFGCALGNLLAICGAIANQQNMGFWEVLSRLNVPIVEELMLSTFSPMDLLFYGIAVYEGYRLSIRRVTQKDIAARITGWNAG